MSTGTLELSEVDRAFTAALDADAGAAAAAAAERGPAAAAPPRKSDNPDAPHGLDGNGVPLAPYGHKADGRPRIKPGGPGRARPKDPDDKARVATLPSSGSAASSSSGPAADGADYTAQLQDLGTTVWLTASMLRGGRLFIVPVPDARPYAAVWRQQLPGLVSAWAVAARQSPAVRGYLERVSGDGAWSWKVGVAVTMVGLGAACMEMAKAPADVKAAAAEANDLELAEFMTAQIAELGLAPDGPGETDQAAAA